MLEHIFCSPVTVDNRNKVRYAADRVNTPNPGERMIGYIFESDGRYRTYWMEFTPDNLARFICSDNKDKLVCNDNHYALLNTMGNYLDLCFLPDEFRKHLISNLESYQNEKEQIITFVSLD